MKRFPLLPILAGAIFALLAAGSAEAQCFDCVQEAQSNPVNWYCTGGNAYSACTTASNYDPNTCETYTSCNNLYACTTDPGDGDYCSNSNCDPNMPWGNVDDLDDIRDYYCYHYGTWCD
jgi:hypothetical protein